MFHEPYIADEAWKQLISDELKSLEVTLIAVDGHEKIINKIRAANNRNLVEKITLFFSMLGIIIGEQEKQAIALRNKMTHSARDYSVDDIAHEDIILTRVYQGLFNRALLMLLGYNEYYIDYSMEGSPSKHISHSAGK